MNPHIKTLQAALGFAGRDLDGKRGPKTNAAILAAADAGRLSVLPLPPVVALPLPEASEAKLAGVNPVLVDVVRAAHAKSPVPFAVIEGLRTRERQAKLVKAGASKTMNSYHLTGHAVDLWPVDPETGRNLPSDAAFPRGSVEARAADRALWEALHKIAGAMKSAAAARGVDLTWGGDWQWKDGPHFQIPR